MSASPNPVDATRAPADSSAWAGEDTLTLLEAITIARNAAAELTDLPVDGIASSAPLPEGGWRLTIEVIESAARMGENDLLAAYEIRLDATGGLTGLDRLRRYRREDGERG